MALGAGGSKLAYVSLPQFAGPGRDWQRRDAGPAAQ